jgi:hypothetical protein
MNEIYIKNGMANIAHTTHIKSHVVKADIT